MHISGILSRETAPANKGAFSLILTFAGFAARAAVPFAPNLVFDGDSLWDRNGAFQQAPNRISDYMKARHPDAIIVNFGVSGQRWNQMTADAVSQVDSRFDPNNPQNILHCGSGINEWEQGWTPTNAYASAVTYLTARKAAGWKLVVNTIPNCYLPGRSSDYWLQYNALLRADPAGLGYTLCDVGADPAFTNYTDTVYRLAADLEPCKPCRVHYSDAAILHWTGLSEVAIEKAFAVALTISREGTQLNVSWPITWFAYQLQAATQLDPQSDWTTLTVNVSIVRDHYEAIVPNDSSQTFLRLIR